MDAEQLARMQRLEGQVQAMTEALKLIMSDRQHYEALYQLLQASSGPDAAAKAYRDWLGQFPKPDYLRMTGG